jgi:hypothetical protein
VHDAVKDDDAAVKPWFVISIVLNLLPEPETGLKVYVEVTAVAAAT